MSQEFQQHWLSAYIDNELSTDERALVERRLEEDPEARQLLDDLKRVRGLVATLPRWEGAGFQLDMNRLNSNTLDEDEVSAAELEGDPSDVEPASDSDDLDSWRIVAAQPKQKSQAWSTAAWRGILSLAAGLLLLILCVPLVWQQAKMQLAVNDAMAPGANVGSPLVPEGSTGGGMPGAVGGAAMEALPELGERSFGQRDEDKPLMAKSMAAEERLESKSNAMARGNASGLANVPSLGAPAAAVPEAAATEAEAAAPRGRAIMPPADIVASDPTATGQAANSGSATGSLAGGGLPGASGAMAAPSASRSGPPPSRGTPGPSALVPAPAAPMLPPAAVPSVAAAPEAESLPAPARVDPSDVRKPSNRALSESMADNKPEGAAKADKANMANAANIFVCGRSDAWSEAEVGQALPQLGTMASVPAEQPSLDQANNRAASSEWLVGDLPKSSDVKQLFAQLQTSQPLTQVLVAQVPVAANTQQVGDAKDQPARGRDPQQNGQSTTAPSGAGRIILFVTESEAKKILESISGQAVQNFWRVVPAGEKENAAGAASSEKKVVLILNQSP